MKSKTCKSTQIETKLIQTKCLRHIEDFSEKRVRNMKEKMIQKGIWEKPICIEKNHFLILDGQHRVQVAKALNLKYIPCVLFNYKDERVEVWSLRKDYFVSKEKVIERVLEENIYPYKTAKHKFPAKIQKCMIPLEKLFQYNDIDGPLMINIDNIV